MWGQETQTDNERILEGLEIILIHARINHIQKDGRDLSTPRQRVLDRCVLREQLSREVGVGDVAVMRWELVTMQTEGADPEFSSGVDLTREMHT
jgi:hypothetical protein